MILAVKFQWQTFNWLESKFWKNKFNKLGMIFNDPNLKICIFEEEF